MTDLTAHLSAFDGDQNLSLGERTAYMAGGLMLAAAGATPRPNPLLNLAALAGGAYLAWSGYKGHCLVKAAFVDPEKLPSTGIPNQVRQAGPQFMKRPPRHWDQVDQESDQSFPASDPPGNY